LVLSDLLSEAVDNLRLQVAQPIMVDDRLGDSRVFWDRQAFLRIFDNLVLNAAKHGSLGTPIHVVQCMGDDHVMVKVSNQGRFPDEVLTNLATPYFISTKSETKGWGLGLPIVKALCESFGGSVAFSNSEGLAQVQVQLPVSLPA
jgi:two-component system sensor histidine kinase/response regulator